jgi:hypothetical protein
MGKKAAHSGLSPKDRSINAMDKFIQRNDRKNANLEKLPARRKDPNIPINLWPLEDQIEYWESRTDVDRFMEKYPTYSSWYAAVKSASGLYPATFIDFTSNLKSVLHELYNQHVEPKLAMIELRKHGVY